ncbi:ExbD/TolR family protein [Gilvimarinus sp. F26214L]|uniref:ExbD/TolR family protein n=1 Tax=Gilvimarinus sp. DZF01 TaxID=3461371 RepID=UPI00404552CD
MAFRYKHKPADEADLDITSFMNLMIVLVPVLLLSITFTQITVHEIKLPDLTGGSFASDESQAQLEVVVKEDGFQVFYPNRKSLIKELPLVETETGMTYDFTALSEVMQEVKSQLSDRRDIVLLANQALDYQSLVSTMDAVKSYRTVLAASVVEVELFPEISLGDAS